MHPRHYKVFVIGAGPSGLAVSYYLKEARVRHLVAERSDRAASSWYQTPDNFRLAMPVSAVEMPGLNFGTPADHRPSRDEIITALNNYAKQYALPIKFNIVIHSIRKLSNSNFLIETNHGLYTAENIIVCIGPRHEPKFPKLANQIPKELMMHSAEYKNTHSLSPSSERKNILVVGSGVSALDITKEILDEAKHTVFIACDVNDAQMQSNNSHLFKTASVFLNARLPRTLEAKGAVNLGRLTQVTEQGLEFRRVKQNGIEITHKETHFFHKIIFATGYKSSFPMLKHLPGMPTDTLPPHLNGATHIPGLYFVGIPNALERTVTINQGSQEARFVTHLILSKDPTYTNTLPIRARL